MIFIKIRFENRTIRADQIYYFPVRVTSITNGEKLSKRPSILLLDSSFYSNELRI